MVRNRAPSLQTKKVLCVLLKERGQGVHGYELIKKIGIKSGTLYPILMRLTDQGFLENEWREPSAPGRPPRQIYRLTTSGIEFAKQNLPEPQLSADPSTDPAAA